jgi:hypothetical protein
MAQLAKENKATAVLNFLRRKDGHLGGQTVKDFCKVFFEGKTAHEWFSQHSADANIDGDHLVGCMLVSTEIKNLVVSLHMLQVCTVYPI